MLPNYFNLFNCILHPCFYPECWSFLLSCLFWKREIDMIWITIDNQFVCNICCSLFVICFGRSQLCPYKASNKFYYVRTYCALHYFIYYAMTTSYKSLITRRLLKRYSKAFGLKVKHLYSIIHNDLNHVFLTYA